MTAPPEPGSTSTGPFAQFFDRGIRLVSAAAVILIGAVCALYEVIDPNSSINRWLSLILFFGLVACARLMESRFKFHRQVERRLDGLHHAARLLNVQGDDDVVIADFLVQVCKSFEADIAELVIERSEGLVVSRVLHTAANSYVRTLDSGGPDGLRAQMMLLTETTRVLGGDKMALGSTLRSDGYRNCIVTRLPSHDSTAGFIVLYNQSHIDGFDRGEVAVLEALAREITSSFEKGKLFAAVLEERYKLSRIVDSTYDGVLTMSACGQIRSWNPGWEQITGIPAADAVGCDLNALLQFSDATGQPVLLGDWTSTSAPLPGELQLTDRAGALHWLSCSYRAELANGQGEGLLTVVAHDKSDERVVEQLREDVDRLAELEAVQRSRVLQLQESLQPAVPKIAEAEFGVYYQPSDTSAPTGGDFYDWQVLPGGDIHIAVVDVLGSGIEATNDAFAVIHTLRTLAYQGIPVEQLVVEADNILATLNPELVATVICVRYNASLGRARLAGGGHPPPLLVRANGVVEEIAAPGIPVGWPGAGSDYPIDVMLDGSDALILYTDGLVEAHRDILQGLEALAITAADTRDYPVADLARILVERSLEGAARRDDSLALVIRHCGVGPVVSTRGFSYRARPVPEEVPAVRHDVTDWLNSNAELAPMTDDLAVVISELATNAARSGKSFFEVRVSQIDGGIALEVEDDGPGFEYNGLTASEHESLQSNDQLESGRGLMIVRTMVDDLTVLRTARGCIVRAIMMTPHKVGEKVG